MKQILVNERENGKILIDKIFDYEKRNGKMYIISRLKCTKVVTGLIQILGCCSVLVVL